MNLPDHDIAFAIDPDLKEHWLDGWAGTSRSGRLARGFIVAGVVGALFFVALAALTTDFGALARGGVERTHLVVMVVAAAACLAVSLGFALALRRSEQGPARLMSHERLTVDREGYLVFSCRDDRELVDTGKDRYFWGRRAEPRRVRASVAYLPACTFRVLDEYRELVIEPRRPGAVRTCRFGSEEQLEASGILRTRLHAGRTPEEFCGGGRGDEDIAVELFPYFSPDPVAVLRELGVPEAPRPGGR